MELSARNQFRGTITAVRMGTVMCEVVVDVGGQEVVAEITRGSAESLGLAVGQQAIAVIKATDVMIGRPIAG